MNLIFGASAQCSASQSTKNHVNQRKEWCSKMLCQFNRTTKPNTQLKRKETQEEKKKDQYHNNLKRQKKTLTTDTITRKEEKLEHTPTSKIKNH